MYHGENYPIPIFSMRKETDITRLQGHTSPSISGKPTYTTIEPPNFQDFSGIPAIVEIVIASPLFVGKYPMLGVWMAKATINPPCRPVWSPV